MAVAAQFDRHAGGGKRTRAASSFQVSVPMLVGMLDSASFLMFLFGIPELPFYVASLSAKAALTIFAPVRLTAARPALPFAFFMFIAIFASTIANDLEPMSVYKGLAVLVSLILTLVLIGRNLREYAVGISLCGSAICVIYLVQVQRGVIGDHFGRLYFFGDSHPNLGGEILGIVVIMSAQCLGPRLYFLLAGAAGYSVWLMQSRSGLLAILVSAAFYVLAVIAKRYGWRRCFVLAACAGFMFVVAVLAGVATGSRLATAISDFFWNSLFLADDEYRGTGTGLTGRDYNWAEAFRIFLEQPFFGAGLEYPDRLGVVQPHNWFLYALAQFGIFGFPVVLSLLSAIIFAMRNGLNSAIALLPVMPLLLINDRFLNFNIYPLGMYVLIFCLSREKRDAGCVERTSVAH